MSLPRDCRERPLLVLVIRILVDLFQTTMTLDALMTSLFNEGENGGAGDEDCKSRAVTPLL